jgi:hypothetical protein
MKTLILVLLVIVIAGTLNAQYISGMRVGSVYIKLGQPKSEITDSIMKYFTMSESSDDYSWLINPKDTILTHHSYILTFGSPDKSRVTGIEVFLDYHEDDGFAQMNSFYNALQEYFGSKPYFKTMLITHRNDNGYNKKIEFWQDNASLIVTLDNWPTIAKPFITMTYSIEQQSRKNTHDKKKTETIKQ